MRPQPQDRRALVAFALLGSLKALALVLVAEGVARGVVAVIETSAIETESWMPGATLIAAGGILRALLAWTGSSLAARASIGEKERLRRRLAEHVVGNGGRASTAVIGSLGLDELDAYYRQVLPALATVATVPLLVGARILSTDWVSALVVVLTVPLVPLFMALVGLHTRDRADAASATLQRLSDHKSELARGLPVLVGLGRVGEQSEALRRIGADHRATTMATLRTAFLSSLVLELIATISVAVVAVFVGIRLMHGDLPLELALVALVLAPECFAPFRELGSAFHSAQDGQAARRAVEAMVSPSSSIEPVAAGRTDDITVTDLTVHGIGPLSFTLPRNSVTALDGPSGSGKSSVLGVLAELDSVAYVPQHPHTVGDTVIEELAYYGTPGDVLARLGLDGLEQVDPARLSPGELRRLAVARALLRVEAGARLLLLDEPTAHLDASSAALVFRELSRLRGRVTMVIASHEAEIAELAERHVSLGQSTRRTSAAEAVSPRREGSHPPPAHTSGHVAESTRHTLFTFLRPTAWRFAAAGLIGTAAALFAIALTAVSGWLIVRASEETAIMYLLVAIVGVRFFGLGRAALRYAERLLTHDAVLAAVAELRMRLWNGLAAHGLASRSLARGGVALDYLVAAADAVRDLVPRVVLPPVVALLSSVAAVIAVGVLHPAAVGPLAFALLVALVAAPVAALLGDRVATRSESELRSTVLRRFAALVGAAAELRANGVGDRVRDEITALDAAAGLRSRRSAWARGLGAAVTVVALSLASAAMLSVGADGPITGVLVLLALALIDPLLAHVEAVQQWPALRAALEKIAVLEAPLPATGSAPVGSVTAIALDDLTIDGLFHGLTATATAGDWLIVEGPSGSGKSTLLSVLLGYRSPDSGAVLVNEHPLPGLDVDQLRARIAWCPQEAHVFDSTVRGNLALGRRSTDAEYRSVLDRVGLRLDLDARVGSEGSRLSGGQRQRLAVARTLLTNADVVLLDEPTAHLDGEAAENLIADLRRALADRIVVLVTHHASERRGGDILLRLGSALATAAVR